MNYPPEFYIAKAARYSFYVVLAKIALHFSKYLFPIM